MVRKGEKKLKSQNVKMKRQLFLAVDVGTQSTRVALLDPQGKIAASHSAGYDLVTPRPGWAEQDPEIWWEAAVRGIRDVLQAANVQAGEILAVCSDAQMHATIPLGACGELLSRGVQLWCDKRPGDLVGEFSDHPFLEAATRMAGSPPQTAQVPSATRVLARARICLSWLRSFSVATTPSTKAMSRRPVRSLSLRTMTQSTRSIRSVRPISSSSQLRIWS